MIAGESRRVDPTLKLDCPHCSTRVSQGGLKAHQRRPPCRAAKLRATLVNAGLEEVTTNLAKLVLGAVPNVIRRELTGLARGKQRKLTTSLEQWAPAWAVGILREHWVLSGDLRDEVVAPHFARMISAMIADPDYHGAVLTVRGLGSYTAVRNLALGPKFRAEQFRAQASALMVQVTRLTAEADALDPP